MKQNCFKKWPVLGYKISQSLLKVSYGLAAREITFMLFMTRHTTFGKPIELVY